MVRRDALITPCQADLPRIRNGHFGVTVFGAGQAGCGGPGTSVRFWTNRGEQIFNDRWVPWSRLDRALTLRFSTADPDGAMPSRTEISGRAFDARGRRVPLGTRIEARVGSTTCGVASVRAGGGFRGYVMNIVGPDSVPACTDGATDHVPHRRRRRPWRPPSTAAASDRCSVSPPEVPRSPGRVAGRRDEASPEPALRSQ